MFRRIVWFIGICLFIAAAFAAWFMPQAYRDLPTGDAKSFEVKAGTSLGQVADRLEGDQIIQSALAYKIYSRMDSRALQVKPGVYSLIPGTSFRSLAQQLSLGPERDETSVRFIEGQDLEDYIVLLGEYGISETEARDLVGDPFAGKPFAPALREEFSFLKSLPANASLEGYVFPNTYRVWKDQLPLGLLLKQLNAFETVTEGYAEDAKSQGRDLREVVILASIVEEEGRNPEERRMIAGVFFNRIKIGMRLQSDATVNYVTKAGRARPTYEDLEADSPYNTYKNDGLPPAPICNPGEEALEAALHPAEHDYYFYLHDEDGNIYYARNIEEHKKNRWKAYGE